MIFRCSKEREYAIGDLPVELTIPSSGAKKSLELQVEMTKWAVETGHLN